jgi:hypothetical protein
MALCDLSVHAGLLRDPQFVRVTAELMHVMPGRLQNLRNQQSQFAIAQNSDSRAARNHGLIENFAGGGKRFGEQSDFGGN